MRFFCHKPGKLLNFRQCTAPHASLCLCRREAGKIKNEVVIERFSLPRVCLRVLSQSPRRCPSSTAPTTPTSSLPFSQPVSAETATASARISRGRSSQSPRRTCLNIAPTAQTPSIRCSSDAKSSRSTIPSTS